MHYWPVDSRASSRSYTNPDYDTSSEYSDPSERRRYRYAAATSCAIDDDPIGPADPMAVSESTKLKGVYWPGMDIFDSATPEMRRKRNQKKDSSVVEQLELNSLDVEATELIFTPQGSFKRQRRISCSDSDDDDDVEIKTESPPTMRRRPILANMDINAGRRARHITQSMFAHLSRNQHDSTRGRQVYDANSKQLVAKRKRFDVFQDDDVPFSQPSSMAYLTAGFTHQPSPSPTPASVISSYKPFNDSFQYEDKENVLPSFRQAGHGNYHNHHNMGYHFPGYSYGLAPEHHSFQYNTHMYNVVNGYQQDDDDDDQRTITAPPSPTAS